MQPPSNHRDNSPTTAGQAAALQRLAIDHAAFFAQWAEWATAHLASLLNALDPSSPPDTRSELLSIEVADSLIPATGWGDWAFGYALAVADAASVEVPESVRLAAEVLHGWAVDVGQGLGEHGPAMPSDARADRLTVALRCDFCGREVPGPIRLVFTWTAIQYRWCERCKLPTGSPVELLLEPPISPN